MKQTIKIWCLFQLDLLVNDESRRFLAARGFANRNLICGILDAVERAGLWNIALGGFHVGAWGKLDGGGRWRRLNTKRK